MPRGRQLPEGSRFSAVNDLQLVQTVATMTSLD